MASNTEKREDGFEGKHSERSLIRRFRSDRLKSDRSWQKAVDRDQRKRGRSRKRRDDDFDPDFDGGLDDLDTDSIEIDQGPNDPQ
jgi:hypothetical protein